MRTPAVVRGILRHPMNRGRRLRAAARYLSWQLGSRLVPGAIAVPFVDATRLLVARGMTGATGNVYNGLHEFEDMGFVLHVLRPGDRFLDVGANVGVYTVLAIAAGADAVAVEPIPATFERLLDNVRINGAEARVRCLNVGVGSRRGQLRFTTGLDTRNRVVADGEDADRGVEVPVETVDDLVADAVPVVMKVDVEGYETEVLEGGRRTLASHGLRAIVIELNGSGARYGHGDREILDGLRRAGFRPARYDPDTRRLGLADGIRASTGNTLFVRDPDGSLAERVRTAPSRRVHGRVL